MLCDPCQLTHLRYAFCHPLGLAKPAPVDFLIRLRSAISWRMQISISIWTLIKTCVEILQIRQGMAGGRACAAEEQLAERSQVLSLSPAFSRSSDFIFQLVQGPGLCLQMASKEFPWRRKAPVAIEPVSARSSSVPTPPAWQLMIGNDRG